MNAERNNLLSEHGGYEWHGSGTNNRRGSRAISKLALDSGTEEVEATNSPIVICTDVVYLSCWSLQIRSCMSIEWLGTDM